MATSQPIKCLQKIKTISKLLSNSSRDHALFVVGINTALRGSDLLALTMGQVGDIKAGGTIHIKERKTGKPREVYFNKRAAEAIQLLLASQEFFTDEPLFQNKYGKQLTRDSLSRMVRDWCKLVGLERLPGKTTYGAHTLRKSLGYHMYRDGAKIGDLMNIFNHSTPGQTLTYICIESREVRALHEGTVLG